MEMLVYKRPLIVIKESSKFCSEYVAISNDDCFWPHHTSRDNGVGDKASEIKDPLISEGRYSEILLLLNECH